LDWGRKFFRRLTPPKIYRFKKKKKKKKKEKKKKSHAEGNEVNDTLFQTIVTLI